MTECIESGDCPIKCPICGDPGCCAQSRHKCIGCASFKYAVGRNYRPGRDCVYCYGRLRTITPRVPSPYYDVWDPQKFHKKCWDEWIKFQE